MFHFDCVKKKFFSQINRSKILHILQLPVSYFDILMRHCSVNYIVKLEITPRTQSDLKIITKRDRHLWDMRLAGYCCCKIVSFHILSHALL